MRDVGPDAKKKVGRKAYIDEMLPLDVIIPLMIQHGIDGGFWETLPIKIYKSTNHLVSLGTLQSLDDPEFLRAKSLAMSGCFDFWTNQMHIASIPVVAWIWISKNVAKWRDDKTIQIDLGAQSKASDQDKLERRKQLQLMLREVAR